MKVGILLLTHAPLGQAFISAATHVFRARPERLESIDVNADQDTCEVERLAKNAIRQIDDGSGVLVITDVMGGTPSNCSVGLCGVDNVQVIAGISLPMLLRAITYRNDTLDVVVEMALAGGQGGAVRVDNRVRLASN
ncbi:MAG TPA: PTS fructose transporter subunit IIA [Oxalicibacterium sp.]|nr:PTS fructose transporter subunit IIA [Oxalicibacterium sp.]